MVCRMTWENFFSVASFATGANVSGTDTYPWMNSAGLLAPGAIRKRVAFAGWMDCSRCQTATAGETTRLDEVRYSGSVFPRK